MTIFTADDLVNMRGAQTDHMMDQCVILSYSAGTVNEFGEADTPTYTEQAVLACGLDMAPNTGRSRGGENYLSEMTVVQYDAIVRLPVLTVVKETDRIRMIGRFDEPIEDLTYEIVSPIQRGPSGIRLNLRKVVV
jgi:hypothetical protein